MRVAALPLPRLHKPTGQLRARYAGRDFYFGKFDDPASHEKGKRWLAELLATDVALETKRNGNPSASGPSKALQKFPLPFLWTVQEEVRIAATLRILTHQSEFCMTPHSFKVSLYETVAWVRPRMDLSDLRWSMRSIELKPPHDYYRDGNPGFFNDSAYITHVVQTRHRLAGNSSTDPPPVIDGRLLLSDYKTSNHNEATEIESAGFFDWADNPPWDLWIGEYDEYLVAWIPEPFMDIVIRSERVECMGMFHWADESAIEDIIPDWIRLA